MAGRILSHQTCLWRGWLIVFSLVVGVLPMLAQDAPPYNAAPNEQPPPGPANGPPPPPQNDSSAPPEAGSAGQQPDVSFQKFYDSLSSQGTWIQSPDYGYVWQPTVSDPQWAPYTNGHWAYTQDGWTWLSAEPWGWATCHYGRWAFLNGTGWCWVPGYTWGPAWVSWRYGGGYCGWAPLPPGSLVGIDYAAGGAEIGEGFHIGGDCDGYFGIDAGWYNFLPVAYLGESDYRGYYGRREDNARFIARSTNVTNINVNRGAHGGSFSHVSLGGPSFMQASARSQSPIQRLRLTSSGAEGLSSIRGGSVAMYAPRVETRSLADSRPRGTVRTLAGAGDFQPGSPGSHLKEGAHLAGSHSGTAEVHQAYTAPSGRSPGSSEREERGRYGAEPSFRTMRPIENDDPRMFNRPATAPARGPSPGPAAYRGGSGGPSHGSEGGHGSQHH